MKKIKITQKLLNKDFLFIFFNKKRNWLNFKFKIEDINIYPIKKELTKKLHLVIIYNVFIKDHS